MVVYGVPEIRVPLYIGNIGIAIPVNAAFPFYEYLKNSRQFHTHRALDNHQLTKSYENAVAFFVPLPAYFCK